MLSFDEYCQNQKPELFDMVESKRPGIWNAGGLSDLATKFGVEFQDGAEGEDEGSTGTGTGKISSGHKKKIRRLSGQIALDTARKMAGSKREAFREDDEDDPYAHNSEVDLPGSENDDGRDEPVFDPTGGPSGPAREYKPKLGMARQFTRAGGEAVKGNMKMASRENDGKPKLGMAKHFTRRSG